MGAARAHRVSVVVPFYRGERFLPECLASIRAQTLAAHEVIVVDDASGPDSAAWLATLEHVRVHTLARNGGPALARNAGVALATGDLIAFMDHDDTWHPAKLERQVAHLAAHPDCSAVHVGLSTYLPDGSERHHLDKPATLSLADTLTRSHVLPSALMLRRRAFEAVGGFDARFTACEDDEFMIRLLAAGHRVDFIAEPLARLRRFGHGNLSSRWWLVLRSRLRIARDHRALFARTLGRGAALRYAREHLWRVGSVAPRRWGWPLRALALLLGRRAAR